TAFMRYLSGEHEMFIKTHHPNAYKALAEGADITGGFIVPVDFFAGIVTKMPTVSPIRNRARHFVTASDTFVVPQLQYTSNPADDTASSLYGSPIRMQWTNEIPASLTTVDATDPVFGQTNASVHPAFSSITCSTDLVEDAPALASSLQQWFAE